MINFEFQREYTIIIDDFNSKNEEIKREERDFGEYIEKEVFEELRELNKKTTRHYLNNLIEKFPCMKESIKKIMLEKNI